MVYLHITVLVFFTLLILYSLFNLLFVNTIEGLECTGAQAVANDPLTLSKSNDNEIQLLKKKMEELKDIKSRVDNIDNLTKQNTDGIKKMGDEVKKSGSDVLGGLDTNKGSDALPTPKGLE